MRDFLGFIRPSRAARFAAINIAVFGGLYLLGELILHLAWGEHNLLLPKYALMTSHPVYHHTLRANFNGYDVWGPLRNRVYTNSLGFKDASARVVPHVSDRKRILFIGDSFTEGIGLPYEDTFVGQFAAAFPHIEVLNAGVSSYSPSIYYEKIKHLLNSGLHFDETIVFIDISDIQNEAQDYYHDEQGVVRTATNIPDHCSHLPTKSWWQKAFFVADFVNEAVSAERFMSFVATASAAALMAENRPYSRDVQIASWTYNPNTPCYGPHGVQGGVDKAKRQMDRLYDLLNARGVPLSVGVYPWTQQLLYDVEDSLQVRIWHEWCEGKCKAFYNHFPAFFRYKEQHAGFLKRLYIWGDHHLTSQGNRVISGDLAKAYRDRQASNIPSEAE